MSGAKKIAVWHGRTESHGFMVDVFEDEEQGLFVANITASTPALAPALRQPGQPVARMSFEEPEKLRNSDLEILKALTMARLTERYGKVLIFQERSA